MGPTLLLPTPLHPQVPLKLLPTGGTLWAGDEGALSIKHLITILEMSVKKKSF